METDVVCFGAPLNTCFRLTYGASSSIVQPEEDGLDALRESAPADCTLCKLDELFGEDWE